MDYENKEEKEKEERKKSRIREIDGNKNYEKGMGKKNKRRGRG